MVDSVIVDIQLVELEDCGVIIQVRRSAVEVVNGLAQLGTPGGWETLNALSFEAQKGDVTGPNEQE